MNNPGYAHLDTPWGAQYTPAQNQTREVKCMSKKVYKTVKVEKENGIT